MPGPVYLITPEFSEVVLDAAIFVTSTAAGTAKANLVKPQPTDIWRAGGLGIHNIDIDLTTAKAVACAALLFTSLETGTTFTVTAGATQGAATYTSGAITLAAFEGEADTPRRHLIHIPATPQTYRWWRFAIAAQSTAFTAGNVVLGPAWQPDAEYSMSIGGSVGGDLVTTDGGNLIAAAPWREMAPEIDLNILATTEAIHEEKMQRLLRLRAVRKPVLLARDLSTANYTQQRVVWGYIADMTPTVLTNLNFWKWRVRVSGMI